MASFNVSLDDSSPLITYSPSNAWTDTPANDTLVKSYYDSSLHTASAEGATAQISFNGTGIWLYGGLRPGYGAYAASVDGVQVLLGNANSSIAETRQLLAGISGLRMGEHTVTLTSAGTGPIDLDSVIFETSIGSVGASVTNVTLDDTSANITYSPSAADWKTYDSSAFYNNTLHYSQTQGANASLSFTGDAVAVYGTVSPLHANYTVTIDGKTSQPFNASAVRTIHSQTLLYFAENLGSSEHTLVITGNPGENTGKYVDVDFITVYSASHNSSTAATTTTASATPTVTSGANGMTDPTLNRMSGINNSNNNDAQSTGANIDNSSRLSKGAIAGIVIGSLFGLLLLLLLLFFLLRRYRSRAGLSGSGKPDMSQVSPVLPMQTQEHDIEAYPYDYYSHSPQKQVPGLVYGDEKPRPAANAALGARRVSHATQWSQSSVDSSATLHHNEPPLPKWDASAPVPTLVLTTHDRGSTHTRTGSETSTVVGEEVAQGFSEVVLRPTNVSGAPKTAPLRPPRPPSVASSITRYYYEV
ncbi:hypothetical protein WOLCODRAFT_164420 [Wolfiporia cocos MD-104 SS10]|uniref:Transmembrane protein n=1 Tax=Wolfiporia cocos (strain MD-104) TaxID=742152 RepID=A0A2H3JPJ9_WOLCO|nr:hypothetical protein WOLCODRAFT_164420 [Wolfiporia cocos MD-104 SS10]